MNETHRPETSTASAEAPAEGFSDEERAAIQERAGELRKPARKAKASREGDAQAVLDKISEMPEPDRALAERIHAVVTSAAPDLAPKLWYGMPGYAKDGKVLCFFQSAEKFKTRYATLGFNEQARLDDGTMWPTAFALTNLTAADEAQIAQLVARAVS